jgi:LPS sulfotransferase NodH
MKKYNPLADLLSFTAEDEKITAFDWDRVGIKQKYLIIFTGRTGSTLLTKMIQRTGLCGSPEEYFNEGFIKSQAGKFQPNDAEGYIAHLARTFARNGIFGAEIDAMRLRWMEDIIDFGAEVFPPATTPHVWMTRQDLVSQAYSYAAAKTTGLWHVVGVDKQVKTAALNPGGQITDKMIWHNLLDIVANEQSAEAYFSRNAITPLRITYEELIAEKFLTLLRVLRHIGINLPDDLSQLNQEDDPTQRMKYSEKYSFILEFQEKHRAELAHLSQNRATINVPEMKKAMAL